MAILRKFADFSQKNVQNYNREQNVIKEIFMNTYTVKRLRLLQFLVNKGFKDYVVIPDPTTNKNYNWFIFEKTPELEEALREYYSKLGK